MEPTITVDGNQFVTRGLPDAVKVIQLKGPLARQLADLTLHQNDLNFADDCLDAINFAREELPAMREGLWRAALVHVMKCFGSSASRSALQEKKILKGQPQEAIQVFEYFKQLRHKFIVHDENPYTQAVPCAALNNGQKSEKVEQVICLALTGQTLNQVNYGNLKLVIRASLEWTAKQFDVVRDQLKAELERCTYDDLITRPAPQYRAPELKDVGRKRDMPY